MGWKQLIINTITGLLVAVLAGVLVWLFTRAPVDREGLVFDVTQSGGFGNDTDRLTFYVIELHNRGSARADSIHVTINEPNGGVLQRTEAEYRNPVPDGITYAHSRTSFYVRIPSFLPQDFARFSLLYKGNASSPDISVRSSNGIGIAQAKNESNSIFQSRRSLFLSLGLFGILAILSRILATRLVTKFGSGRMLRDRNNAGFVLFHSGLFDLAHKVLNSAILGGDYSSITLSNLASVNAFNGDMISSLALLRTARNWTTDTHSLAVLFLTSSFTNIKQAGLIMLSISL